jgi:flagellar export protein FliJ
MRPFRFALAPLLEARAQEREAARAAYAGALATLAALDAERDGLREREGNLRRAVAEHALRSSGASLRAAYALLAGFDDALDAIAARRRVAAADVERGAETLREASAAWKQVELLAARAREQHERRIRVQDERERDESNLLRRA